MKVQPKVGILRRATLNHRVVESSGGGMSKSKKIIIVAIRERELLCA